MHALNTRGTAALALVLLLPVGAWAGAKTCLTGTDASVAHDASQVAGARLLIGGFGCNCPAYDGSPGKSHADYLHCVQNDVNAVVRSGYVRSQCKATLLKSLRTTTCGWSASLNRVPCVKRSTSGRVTCVIKSSVRCIDVSGQFTQRMCTSAVLPSCADAADTNNDGLIGTGDSGGCAPPPACGNGVREAAEQCDPPSAPCAAGASCIDCVCATPTQTATVSAPPVTTNTTLPNATPTPTPIQGSINSAGCCASATGGGICIDSSAGYVGSALCQLERGTWMPGQHCSCQSAVACAGACLPGPPGPTPTPCSSGFVDNGDGTIHDCTLDLTWEKKDQGGGLHDVNNRYTWAGLCTGSNALCQPNPAAAAACSDATAGALGCAVCSAGATCNVDPFAAGAVTTIWDWLVQLNASNFAGYNDWRIAATGQDGGAPELESILAQVPTCTSSPCVASVFNTACASGCSVGTCSCTATDAYWSSVSVTNIPADAWGAHVNDVTGRFGKDVGLNLRAVRGGN